MLIPRHLEPLDQYLEPNKVLVIYGPRRAGKSTLIARYLETTQKRYKLVSGDDLRIQEILGSERIDTIKQFAEGYELIVVDEAQRIPNIGWGLKILVDHIPGIFVIATGSASLHLRQQVGEPLTGRQIILHLPPLLHSELRALYNSHELREHLSSFLIFGSYPEIVTAETNEQRAKKLQDLANAYLLKDILELDQVRSQDVLLNLLRLLAFQIGHQVSQTELAASLGISKNTVGRYLALLEQSFVIFKLPGFSRNLRKEITKKHKYFFYDLGIRNALIANLNQIDLRPDAGQLWENFFVSERMKLHVNEPLPVNHFFWRTWDQKEIDLIEEAGGDLSAFECKWTQSEKPVHVKIPASFQQAYPKASFTTVTPQTYQLHLLGKTGGAV